MTINSFFLFILISPYNGKNQPQNRLHKYLNNAQNLNITAKLQLKHGGFVGCIFLLAQHT